MRFSIKDSSSLCHSCTESQITKDARGKERILCHFSRPMLRINVLITECNKYERIGSMSSYAAEKIGWVLEKKGSRIGFKPPGAQDE